MTRDVAILQLMHAPGLGQRKIFDLLCILDDRKMPVEEFLLLEEREMTEEYHIPADAARYLHELRDDALTIADEMLRHEIAVVATSDSDYPERLLSVLQQNAPPVLFAQGNIRLLTNASVAISGARKAVEETLQQAYEIASRLAGSGVNIISGYAEGVDSAAHRAAFECGGTTILVPATGILHFRWRAELANLVDHDNYLVLSEFLPRVGWQTYNAMRRNRTICALSHCLLAFEPGLDGGTQASAIEALRLGLPVFVVPPNSDEAPSQAVSRLLMKGAKLLPLDEGGVARIDEILQTLP